MLGAYSCASRLNFGWKSIVIRLDSESNQIALEFWSKLDGISLISIASHDADKWNAVGLEVQLDSDQTWCLAGLRLNYDRITVAMLASKILTVIRSKFSRDQMTSKPLGFKS